MDHFPPAPPPSAPFLLAMRIQSGCGCLPPFPSPFLPFLVPPVHPLISVPSLSSEVPLVNRYCLLAWPGWVSSSVVNFWRERGGHLACVWLIQSHVQRPGCLVQRGAFSRCPSLRTLLPAGQDLSCTQQGLGNIGSRNTVIKRALDTRGHGSSREKPAVFLSFST